MFDGAHFVAFARDSWKLVATFVFAGFAAAVGYLNVATYTYEVSFRVSPTESGSGNLANRLGGLAAVAGLSLGADRAVQPFELYVEAFYSPEVAARLSTRPDLMHTAFPDEWNAAAGQWEEPHGLVRTIGRSAKSMLGIPVFAWQPPDAERLKVYIEEEVILVRDPKRSVTTFSIDHEDPKFAAELLRGVHDATDAMVRDRALRRANSYIAYLSAKLPEVTLVEHREVLAQTLGEQERIRMMSSSSMPYAAEPLGAPLISPRPTKPRPVLTLAVGILGGGFAGMVAALGRRLLRLRRSVAPGQPRQIGG